MQSLFKPGSKINQDHKYKYIHILAYAASVVETWKKVPRKGVNFLINLCVVRNKKIKRLSNWFRVVI